MITTGENLTGTFATAFNTYLALSATITFIDMGANAQTVLPHYQIDAEPAIQDIEVALAANGRATHVLTVAGTDATLSLAQDMRGTIAIGKAVLTSYGRDPIDSIRAFHRFFAAVNRNDNYSSALIPNKASEFVLGGITFYKFFAETMPKAALTAKAATGGQQPIFVTGSILDFEVEIEAPA